MSALHRPDYKRFLRIFSRAFAETGLKQDTIAKKLGKPQSFVSKALNGERRVDVTELIEICEAAGIDYRVILKEYGADLGSAS